MPGFAAAGLTGVRVEPIVSWGMPVDLNLAPLRAEARPETRLALGETKRHTFRADSPWAGPAWLPTVSWHEPDLLRPPKPEGATEPLAPISAKTSMLDDFEEANYELRIHTTNV